MKKLNVLALAAVAALAFGTAAQAEGVIATPAPAAAPAYDFTTLDTNNDGALSVDELARAGVTAESFKTIDTDNNGSVSVAEFNAHLAAQHSE